MTVAVTAIHPEEGGITVGYGTDDAGRRILFAGDKRLMAVVADELTRRRPVLVTVESWQVLVHGE